MQKKAKQKKCPEGEPGCKKKFAPFNSLQKTCINPKCALSYARKQKKRKLEKERKAQVKQTRVDKERLKTRKQLTSEAQTAFNKFIRTRDELADHGCIDCGQHNETQKVGGVWDAGHYLSVGSAPELRFNEDNCHRQLKGHNRPGGTTRAKFRAGMIKRIGQERLDKLEGPHPPAKWSPDDLREIRDTYRRKANELKNREVI